MVGEYLEETERHGRCRTRPYAQVLEYVHGAYKFELYCHSHLSRGEWTKSVTAAEAARLVQVFVDKALAARSSEPPADLDA